MSDKEMALCLVAHGQYTDMEIADMAASDTGTITVVRFAVKDRINKEITIGHMAVVVFCGSGQCAEQFMNGLSAIDGAKRRDT